MSSPYEPEQLWDVRNKDGTFNQFIPIFRVSSNGSHEHWTCLHFSASRKRPRTRVLRLPIPVPSYYRRAA